MGEELKDIVVNEDFDIVIKATLNGESEDAKEFISIREHSYSPTQQHIICWRELDMDGEDDEENSGNLGSHIVKDGKRSSHSRSTLKSAAAGSQRSTYTIPRPYTLATESRHFEGNHARGNGEKIEEKSSTQSPILLKKSSSMTHRKPLEPENTLHNQDYDLHSVASTAATVRNKFKPTIPVAPTFRSGERAEKRKAFALQVTEKQKILEEEKQQAEARKKEEQDAAIRVMRKGLFIRANPVPSFYHEGHPPKPELKKVPPTRAKSPKLTRRKSCSDCSNSPLMGTDGPCSRLSRHSVGSSSEVSSHAAAAAGKARPRITGIPIHT